MNRRHFIYTLSAASAGIAAGEIGRSAQLFAGNQGYPNYCNECNAKCGVIISSKEGEIKNIYGNDNHPVNHGSLCPRGLKAMRGMYSSTRMVSPLINLEGNQKEIDYDLAKKEFASQIMKRIKNPEKTGLLLPFITGTEYKLLHDFMDTLNIKNYLCYENSGYDYLLTANKKSFGINAVPQYELSSCDAIVAFNCDFLDSWLSPVKLGNDFKKAKEKGCRLVYVGNGNTETSLKSDKQYRLDAEKSYYFALAVLNSLLYVCYEDLALAKIKKSIARFTPDFVAQKYGIDKDSICDVFETIKNTKQSAVLGGDYKSEYSEKTAAVINLINFLAGNFGKSIYFGNDYSCWNYSDKAEIDSFKNKIKSGEIDFVITYKFPANGLQKILSEKPDKLYIASLISYQDDAMISDLAFPVSLNTESWGDSESLKGLYNIHEPALFAPKGVKSGGDVLLDLIKEINPKAAKKFPAQYKDYLWNNWQNILKELGCAGNSNGALKAALNDGFIYKELPIERPHINENILSFFE